MTCSVVSLRSLARSVLLALPFAVASLSGCGGSLPNDRGAVSGVVTVDGERVEAGSIVFRLVDGTAPAVGGRIADGEYSLVVPVGACEVAVRVPKVVGEAKLYNTPDSPVREVRAESLPPKYNDETELTREVSHGDNSIDFDLSTT